MFRFRFSKDIHVGGARPHSHDFKERAKSFSLTFSKVALKSNFGDVAKIGPSGLVVKVIYA